MKVNPVNQAADVNLPITNNPEKKELQAAVNKQKKPTEDVRDQIEIKEVAPEESDSVKQKTSLKFSRDQQTNELVVELVNNQTGESVRQIPSEVSLKLSAIYAQMQGKLVNKNY